MPGPQPESSREEGSLAYGVRDCDSPMSLVNVTFDWLKKEWADEIDFVIWTGDNARSVSVSIEGRKTRFGLGPLGRRESANPSTATTLTDLFLVHLAKSSTSIE